MRKEYIFLLIILTKTLFAQSLNTDTTKTNGGIIYGDNHAFTLSAPKGWILDNKSGVSQDLHAVFYPEGGSWENSSAVMYANTAQKTVEGNETLDNLINYDTLRFRKNYQDVIIYNSPNLKTSDNKEAKVVCFIYSNYDAVAYIDESKIVSMIALTSRDEKNFKESFPAFEKLVGSYFFITSEVNINK